MGDPIPAIVEAIQLFRVTNFTIGGHTLNYLNTLIGIIVVFTVLDVVLGFLGRAANIVGLEDDD